ncbi:MAG: hypothetical protein H8E98_03580 [Bacteroidetes bacterium]|nr:hypothetical protein [Bacteroidota bacterium]
MKIKIKGETYKVTWVHNRFQASVNQFAVNGGATECIFKSLDTEDKEYYGMAYCREDEPYVKAIGRKHSFARALDNLDITKEERKELWDQYLNEVTIYTA